MCLPKVSIITVYHNREDGVNDSIKSLMNQTYSNIEIIVIDDCSKDSTNEKLEKLHSKDNRIRIIRNKKNKGFTNSIIDVINDINTEFIAIHGSGDLSLPNRIKTQVDYLEKNIEVGVVGVGVVNRPLNNISKSIKNITSDDLIKRNCLNHGTVMFRRDVYIKAGGYRSFFKYRQDKDLWFRMVLHTKIHFLPSKLYKWVKQAESVSETSGINTLPTLLSEYANFLFKERLKYGQDSLDKYGVHGGLYFVPNRSNFIFFKNFRYYVLRKQYHKAEEQLKELSRINSSVFVKIRLVFNAILLNIIKVVY